MPESNPLQKDVAKVINKCSKKINLYEKGSY